ncbi:hypothetical protein [Streptomyces sp. NPDC097619]|uniref:hypothetical protein n=1 Tax=Streptomyces sp. NPDC097619 TaxID=3157228 RepID=UPI003321C0C4
MNTTRARATAALALTAALTLGLAATATAATPSAHHPSTRSAALDGAPWGAPTPTTPKPGATPLGDIIWT